MSVPHLIPIAYEPEYRTDRIGRYDDGLFFANGWDHHAYLHLFDRDGAHRESTIVRIADRALFERTLEDLVAPLPGKRYGDIAVQLFRTEFEGVLFGLIDESGDRAGDGGHVDWVELHPDRLGFSDPWDGTYST